MPCPSWHVGSSPTSGTALVESSAAGRNVCVMRRHFCFTLVLGLLTIGCADTPQSSEASVRALVEIESDGEWLRFHAGPIDFEGETWSHQVEFELGTDDRLPTFTLSDTFLVDGEGIAPPPSATATVYELSDIESTVQSFDVIVEALPPGTHRFPIAIDVHLQPNPRFDYGYEPVDAVVDLDLVYEVFRVESELDYYCARADQLLWEDTFHFSPKAFMEEGEAALSRGQIASLEAAVSEYEETFEQTRGRLDPNPIFDLIEDFCDVEYPERWAAWIDGQ